MNNDTWEPKGLFGKYAELCFRGLGGGAIVGGYIGATIGFTGALVSPAAIGYGLVKGARILLRK
jgi:hypothetical protein